jgi:ABC-2 type transport system ATP-binding protein
VDEHILSLQGVVKAYDKKVAVDHVSFNVAKGSIFGLLGPNGAGKTSIIRIITGITQADAGSVYLDGSLMHTRQPEKIGYMPEERGLYKKMKVGDQLLYLARLKGLSLSHAKERIDYWMDRFQITDWWDRKVEELSKGMQQKIQFITTIVHQPQLLILDEPFSGLDPINTNLIKEEIYQLKQQGVSIIFSTHRMEQVEEICEHIVLINNGKNVLDGDVNAIKERFKLNQYHIQYSEDCPLNLNEKLHIITHKNSNLVVQAAEGQSSNELLRFLLSEGLNISSFKEVLPTLNEIFIKQVENDN